MKSKNKEFERKVNWKVVIYGMFGLICLALTYYVHWLFILGCAIVIWINQRELMNQKKF